MDKEILNFYFSPGMWQWLDKTVMDYTNWGGSQSSDNSYGSIRSMDGQWSTGSRWYDRAYICKTPKSETIILITTQFELMFVQ